MRRISIHVLLFLVVVVASPHVYIIHDFKSTPAPITKNAIIPDEVTTDCLNRDEQHLCVPNSYLLCLANGTLLCVTPIEQVVSCGFQLPPGVSYNNHRNTVCTPCVANVTLITRQYRVGTVIERSNALCVSTLAQPHSLQTTVPATLALVKTAWKFLANLLN